MGEIEVESMDKAGNFIGYLFVDNTNLSLHLVQEGFASMHFTAEKSAYGNQIRNAEENAKSAKKRIWTNYTGDQEKASNEEEEKAALIEDLREEFTNNPPLAGAYQPKRNDLCAAKFVDDQWYRARVEKTGASEVQVLYIDYGNRATVPKTKLGTLPGSFQTPGGFAKLFSLALIHLPADEDNINQGIQALKDDLLDRTVKINVEYKTGTDTFVTAQVGDEDIGKGLVGDGLFLVERKGGRRFAKMLAEYNEAMAKAKRDHLAIWQYGDITEDDAKEFGAGTRPAR